MSERDLVLETALNFFIERNKEDEEAQKQWQIIMLKFSASLNRNNILSAQLEMFRRNPFFDGGIPNE
jgi:hypothetical protein